jgi:hypothetical protein
VQILLHHPVTGVVVDIVVAGEEVADLAAAAEEAEVAEGEDNEQGFKIL